MADAQAGKAQTLQVRVRDSSFLLADSHPGRQGVDEAIHFITMFYILNCISLSKMTQRKALCENDFLSGKHSKFEIKISFLGAAPHSFKIKLLGKLGELTAVCDCCLLLQTLQV